MGIAPFGSAEVFRETVQIQRFVLRARRQRELVRMVAGGGSVRLNDAQRSPVRSKTPSATRTTDELPVQLGTLRSRSIRRRMWDELRGWQIVAKRRGRHPEKALTAVGVRQAKKPGRYADGNGLYLVVDPTGAKRWVLRTVVQRRRRDIGLGGLSVVGLAEARDLALTLRKTARAGGDPLSDRRKTQSVSPTFAEAAERVHEEHRHGWKNEKHAQQWLITLQTYAYPTLGKLAISNIDAPDILKTLGPIWLSKPETARRVRQRIGTVLDWAKAAGFRTGDNPVQGVTKGLPKQTDRQEHHAAIPYARVPAFIHSLRASPGSERVKLAFEFLILTASRTNEVLGMKWSELDLGEKLWTVPAVRMKAKREHRIPLSDRGAAIVEAARPLALGSDYVFPGTNEAKPMSNMVFLMTLRRMNVDATAHGFRSSFRDWASEQTNFPREVCEAALAHTIESKVEAAYRRSDLFNKRRELMANWSIFILEGANAGQ